MSSYFNVNAFPGSEVIDGIFDEDQWSLAHTEPATSPWIQVNLGVPAMVRGVKIWNRAVISHPGNHLLVERLQSEHALKARQPYSAINCSPFKPSNQ